MFVSLLDQIARILEFVGRLVLAFMALTIFYDSTMRYLFAAPTSWSLEVNSFLMVFVALMVAAEVERRGEHIGISLLPNAMPPRVQRAMQIVVSLTGATFCAILAWRGFMMSQTALEYGERVSSAFGTPIWIPYALLPIGFTALGAQFLLTAIRGRPEADPEKVADGI